MQKILNILILVNAGAVNDLQEYNSRLLNDLRMQSDRSVRNNTDANSYASIYSDAIESQTSSPFVLAITQVPSHTVSITQVPSHTVSITPIPSYKVSITRSVMML